MSNQSGSSLQWYPYGSLASSTTTYPTTTVFPQQYQQATAYGYATAAVEREHKIEVPIVEKGDRAGIFLKDEKGNLIHVDAERLYKAIGLDW